MRCLALSEEIMNRGHEAYLLTNNSEIEWLEELLAQTKVHVVRTEQHYISEDICEFIEPDWVIVDSYEISPSEISKLSSRIKILAIVDGDTRGIVADYYLDQNLGAEHNLWPFSLRDRIWAGSEFTVIRDEILSQKRERPWELRQNKPHLVAFMGGTDPTGAILDVSVALRKLHPRCTATVVAANQWQLQVKKLLQGLSGIEIVSPTSLLPGQLAIADIVISASGTSSWDLLTLGIPSILIAVVDNQLEAHRRITESNLALGIIRSRGGEIDVPRNIEKMALRLISEKSLREQLSRDCIQRFNGAGKSKIVEKLEENILR